MDKQRKRALKQVARRSDQQVALELLPVAPKLLAELFDFLDETLSLRPCEHDLNLTREWCRLNNIHEQNLIAWTETNGGFCDCEVLTNVEQSFREALEA